VAAVRAEIVVDHLDDLGIAVAVDYGSRPQARHPFGVAEECTDHRHAGDQQADDAEHDHVEAAPIPDAPARPSRKPSTDQPGDRAEADTHAHGPDRSTVDQRTWRYHWDGSERRCTRAKPPSGCGKHGERSTPGRVSY
jgi:hypothetical protein